MRVIAGTVTCLNPGRIPTAGLPRRSPWPAAAARATWAGSSGPPYRAIENAHVHPMIANAVVAESQTKDPALVCRSAGVVRSLTRSSE